MDLLKIVSIIGVIVLYCVPLYRTSVAGKVLHKKRGTLPRRPLKLYYLLLHTANSEINGGILSLGILYSGVMRFSLDISKNKSRVVIHITVSDRVSCGELLIGIPALGCKVSNEFI